MIVLLIAGAVVLIFLVFVLRNWKELKRMGETTKWSDVVKTGRAVSINQKPKVSQKKANKK